MKQSLQAILLALVAFGLVASDVQAAAFEVEVKRDIPYDAADETDPKRQLDLYLPKGHKDFPVVFFVHGGGWRHGDKRHRLDVYGNLGRMFARNGIGAVVVNYRLSPRVQHPAHIQDVAKAFAWTCHNIAKYGGRQDQILISGHSAGAHLVALLATDPTYLEAEKLSADKIKGVVVLSGIYKIPAGGLFNEAFGESEEVRRQASPLTHVKGKHPPFLIMYADGDLPVCRDTSEQFFKALKENKADVLAREINNRNHFTIIASMGRDEEPVARAALEFIAKRTGVTLPALEASK